MKITFGRKFLAAVILTVVLLSMFFVTLFKYPAAVDQLVVITYGAFLVTTWLMYVGGNVWSSWIKSKYFRSELHDSPN